MHDAPLPARAAGGHLALTHAELEHWGTSFGRIAQAPLVVTVSGDLGAGKTTLVQAICRGYGVTEEVTSPTFALVHQYASSRGAVLHLDLYRLDGPHELDRLGWDEMMAEHALILIEWPERAEGRIPAVHVPIELDHLPDDADKRLLYAGGHVGEETFGGHP
jgi:tRNA threonylcarbamoyladenosine biosynthesis protein TsaE